MNRNGFQEALAKKLRKQTSLLTDKEVAFATRMTLKMLQSSFGDNPYLNAESMERIIRWSSLRARCERERERRGLSLKEASLRLKIPQYRLRAIESGEPTAFDPEMAREYFRFLGIERWVDRWREVNGDLARSEGLGELTERSRKRRSSQK